MPLFDLGSQLNVTQTIQQPQEASYELCKQVLEAYARHGYVVQFQQQRPSTDLQAEFSGNDGTRIRASVKLSAVGPNASRLVIQLSGKVFVGGLKGALADDQRVQQAAKDMLVQEIRKALQSHGLVGALQMISQREVVYCNSQQTCAARFA